LDSGNAGGRLTKDGEEGRLMALNVSASTARFQQLSGALRKTYTDMISSMCADPPMRFTMLTSICHGTGDPGNPATSVISLPRSPDRGLLHRRRVTMHWLYSELLATAYPSIQVNCSLIFARDGNIYSSGGITAGIDLALALVEEDLGREVALATSRTLVVFPHRPGGQSQFSSYVQYRGVRSRGTAIVDPWAPGG
jgi:hypothetical protein